MKASELRIGNQLQTIEGKKPTIVSDIIWLENDEFTFWCYGYKAHQVEPIPLTEEWLVKFGFIKLLDRYEKTVTKDGECKKFFINISRYGFQFESWKPLIYVYVHQLQNVYFALTGEELTIKD